ncbi:hypothetical protein H2200_002634 [Cladophialophora chaetospira]|uniref:Uncharacterized protein n=1 Tax=Cladophialophora chaetospira TaxID=386627 RepID=A0AA39CN93_9EURO|nr:hypothetical protein H2200_002634 [Cladophialophora chaetospira]
MAPITRELLSKPSGLKKTQDFSQWFKEEQDQSRLERSAMRARPSLDWGATQVDGSVDAGASSSHYADNDSTPLTPHPQPSTESVHHGPPSDAATLSPHPMHHMGRSSAGDNAITRIFTQSEAYRYWVHPRNSRYEPLFTELYDPPGSDTRHRLRFPQPQPGRCGTEAYEANRSNNVQHFTSPALGTENTRPIPNVDVEHPLAAGFHPSQAGPSRIDWAGGPQGGARAGTAEMVVPPPYIASHQAFPSHAPIPFQPPVLTNPYSMHQQRNSEQTAGYPNPSQTHATNPIDTVQWNLPEEGPAWRYVEHWDVNSRRRVGGWVPVEGHPQHQSNAQIVRQARPSQAIPIRPPPAQTQGGQPGNTTRAEPQPGVHRPNGA